MLSCRGVLIQAAEPYGRLAPKKRPHHQVRSFYLNGGPPRSRTGHQRIMRTTSLSPPLSGSWSGLSLAFTARPYSLYTLLEVSQGLARDYHADAEASPNLSDSTKGRS